MEDVDTELRVQTQKVVNDHDIFAGEDQAAEGPEALEAVASTGRAICEAGMRFNAGHALNYFNVQPIAALPGVRELHIGHAIVSRAIFAGLRDAVREMKRLMREAVSEESR